jgi:peptidoglycan/LPS O-acetylase OafA/YrhL
MDALRGLAAIAVLFYHFGTRLGAPVSVAHGYLAVDFFFMLSGFVLAHAYTDKLPALSVARFTLIRAARLLPMSMIGIVIGTVYFLVRWKAHWAASDTLPQILSASGLNLALIPKPWVAGATSDETFPANGVLWSLSFEFAINLVWASALVRLRPPTQLALALSGAAALAYYVGVFGDANLGWNWRSYAGGAGRTLFGFLVGVVLWRRRPVVRTSWIRPLLASAVLVVALCLPFKTQAYDLSVILLVFPAMIYLAASADFGVGNRVVKFLADISYPVYAVHLPILMALSGAYKRFAPSGDQPPAIVYVLAAPIVLLAWALGRWCEAPARRWLDRRLLGTARAPDQARSPHARLAPPPRAAPL